MSVHDLFSWLVGLVFLLYFIVAMVKPEWFLYLPAEERKALAEQRRLLSPDRDQKESEQVPLMKGLYPR